MTTSATPLHGPAFGSYPADDVTWLLKDLSHVELEAPVEEREEAIQAGRAICDIMAANPPNSKYAQSTRDFCGAGDPPPGEPGDPPDWGD